MPTSLVFLRHRDQAYERAEDCQLFLQNPHGPHPVPAAGYKVYLYSRVGQAWIGPVLTDSQGRYAFFNRPNGDYLLRVIQSDKQVFEQQVTIPMSLAPIVL